MYHHYDGQIPNVESALTGNFCCTHVSQSTDCFAKGYLLNIAAVTYSLILEISFLPPKFYLQSPPKIQNISKIPYHGGQFLEPKYSRHLCMFVVHCLSFLVGGNQDASRFVHLRQRVRRALHNASCTW